MSGFDFKPSFQVLISDFIFQVKNDVATLLNSTLIVEMLLYKKFVHIEFPGLLFLDGYSDSRKAM